MENLINNLRFSKKGTVLIADCNICGAKGCPTGHLCWNGLKLENLNQETLNNLVLEVEKNVPNVTHIDITKEEYFNNGIDFSYCVNYINHYKRAKKRGIECNMSLKRYKQLRKTKKCFYTKVLLTSTNFSIDRIDATIGYTDRNVVACDKDFNVRKDNLSLEDIKMIVKSFKSKKLM